MPRVLGDLLGGWTATLLRIQWAISAAPISQTRGFLPDDDPVVELPEAFREWEELGKRLPKILVSDRVRATLLSAPPFPTERLETEGQAKRAMLLLSYLGHAYVYGEGESARLIPRKLSEPWCRVAERVGRPPVLSYASHALDNWRRIDPQRDVEVGNIHLIQNFTAGIDEEWFFLIHIAIEKAAAPALAALVPMQEAVAANDEIGLIGLIGLIGPSLEEMYRLLQRMPEHCDPYIYYHRIRPFLHGWKNHPVLTEGLIYEGEFGDKPVQFRGGSGAQSSVIPAIDAALGISHGENDLGAYLKEMRDYMPPEHRAFITSLESGPSVRDFARSGSSDLRGAYDGCVQVLEDFRTHHLEFAATYVFKQAQTDKKNPSALGTGGTPFMKFLKKHRDSTRSHRLG
jgi:indoleamine 2,3-dioxygenase